MLLVEIGGGDGGGLSVGIGGIGTVVFSVGRRFVELEMDDDESAGGGGRGGDEGVKVCVLAMTTVEFSPSMVLSSSSKEIFSKLVTIGSV